jgi:hypothetical protein
MVLPTSIMEEHLTYNPKSKGSNPAHAHGKIK